MDVARVLRQAREDAALGQRQLAAKAGISHGSVSRYESGAAVPSLRTVDALLAACGRDLELTLVRRVDAGDALLDELAARPPLARVPDWETRFLLRRVAQAGCPAVLAGRFAVLLHGLPAEPGDGLLVVTPRELPDLVAALTQVLFAACTIDGERATVRPREGLLLDPRVRWLSGPDGGYRVRLLDDGVAGPPEQRLWAEDGAVLRVLAPSELRPEDGVRAEVLDRWRRRPRGGAGPVPAT
jgi:transcriptional regulator with XRE-family HTH domain